MCLSTIVRVLRRAAREMAAAGDAPYLGDFDTCWHLGEFLDKCASEVQAGNRASLERLWFIFAPTCDWDDAGGSQDIGNRTFAILNRIGGRPAGT